MPTKHMKNETLNFTSKQGEAIITQHGVTSPGTANGKERKG